MAKIIDLSTSELRAQAKAAIAADRSDGIESKLKSIIDMYEGQFIRTNLPEHLLRPLKSNRKSHESDPA